MKYLPQKKKKKQAKAKPLWFSGINSWINKTTARKIGVFFLAFSVLWWSVMYGVAQWYIIRHRGEMVFGATFVPNYARYFDLDPQEVYKSMLDDLGLKKVRLVSYWSDIEKNPGQYDFSELDWQMKMAEERGVGVSLAIGLRQPRWPECHAPEWAKRQSKDQWYPALKNVMQKTIERYKNSPVLESYQLENEFFMTVFGLCWDFDRDRLIDEYDFIKKLDPHHPVVISRSNNWIGVPVGKPTPDEFAISVYKRVWDKSITKRYFEYPLPSWFYSMLAGWGELLTGKDMFIHELQAEPWVPEDMELKNAPIAEQDKSMNAVRLKHRFEYAKAMGMHRADLWGAEWWYWRKVKYNDPSLWNVAKEEINKQF